MGSKEHKREVLPSMPDADYWENRSREGWKLVAVEWEREGADADGDAPWVEDVPYGMKIGADCLHLVENPEEKEVLIFMLEMIVADKPFSEVARSVNARGFRTRAGADWSQVDIFELMPRLVEVASRIYPSHEWSERRKGLFNAARHG